MSCSANIFQYKVGDTQPPISCTYSQKDSNGIKIPVDITGYSFRLDLKYNIPKSVNGTIVDATNGKFKFEFTIGSSELSEVGKIQTEIVIIDSLGNQITYDFVDFQINPRIV